VLLLYSIAVGLLLGRALGGRVAHLEHVRFAWWPLAAAGLLVQVALFSGPVAERIGAAGPAVYVVSTLAVLLALLRNAALPGLAIIAVGAALNLVPILANGGVMPSSPEAWLALTGVAQLPTDAFSNSVLAGPDTAFAFLGDVFVFPRPLPLANVFSLGDAVIALGAVVFLVVAMRGPSAVASALLGGLPESPAP
jgi:hypothetical protein